MTPGRAGRHVRVWSRSRPRLPAMILVLAPGPRLHERQQPGPGDQPDPRHGRPRSTPGRCCTRPTAPGATASTLSVAVSMPGRRRSPRRTFGAVISTSTPTPTSTSGCRMGLPGGMPAWSGTLTETDRWNLVNYLRAINGRGPSPAPSASSSTGRAPELAGLAVSGCRRINAPRVARCIARSVEMASPVAPRSRGRSRPRRRAGRPIQLAAPGAARQANPARPPGPRSRWVRRAG